MSTEGDSPNVSTRERILFTAAQLFAVKGFTETSIRELADAAGVKGSSIYNHFSSKNAILEEMLNDYATFNMDVFLARDLPTLLSNDPTPEGMLSCLTLVFPPQKREYYLLVLCVLLQEQLRNYLVRDYMSQRFILGSEESVGKIIATLVELGYLDSDTDPDYWVKIASSLYYAFATRSMLGIGDAEPSFTGINMEGMLRYSFALLLELHGTEKLRQKMAQRIVK